jgi:phospholipid transport system substrate-binding protein
MLLRRLFLLTGCAVPAAFGMTVARADNLDQAGQFIAQICNELTAVVNGPGTLADKQKQLQAIVDRAVDVDGVARFCLGRYWRTATPAQQQDYLQLFHRVLMINITGKIGEYQGVSLQMGRAAAREGGVLMSTTVNRPNNPPSKVDWLVSTDSGSPKIIDVSAEGVSLRQTQRSDYLAFLSHNSDSVQALIDAMKRQASQPG